MKAKLALLALILTFSLQPATLHAQGSLTPPGPPAPTMKTLDQIEARTIVNSTNTPGNSTNTFIISAPGSYYLTGNITGASGKHGISIQANDVTLDLNGFAIISGGSGAFRGVDVPAAQKNFCIRNGTIRGWTDGGVRTDLVTSTLAETLRLSDNTGATGLFLGNGSARDCVASGNATGFVLGNGAQIRDSSASANTTGFSANDRSQINNCIATVNTGDGFNCTSYVNLMDCTSSRNGGYGILVQGNCSVIRCSATKNIPSGYGIRTGVGCTVSDCNAGGNGGTGIDIGVGSTVRSCTAQGNSIGISVSSSCRVEENTCVGNTYGLYAAADGNRIDGNICSANTVQGFSIQGVNSLFIRNSAHGNGNNNFDLINPASGPIVDVTAGGTITSTSPWANFLY